MSIIYTPHVLQVSDSRLPPPTTASQHYNLRPHRHSLQLPEHHTRLLDSNFFVRMFYKHLLAHGKTLRFLSIECYCSYCAESARYFQLLIMHFSFQFYVQLCACQCLIKNYLLSQPLMCLRLRFYKLNYGAIYVFLHYIIPTLCDSS